MTWQPPIVPRTGLPCKKCRTGIPCPHHRAENRAGRKNRLTPDLVKTAAEIYKQEGFYHNTAARLGISTATWHKWLAQGRKDLAVDASSVERSLVEAVDAAKLDLRNEMVGIVVQAARGALAVEKKGRDGVKVFRVPPDASAAQWMLERTNHEEFGRRERLQHEGVEGGAPLEVRFVDTSKLPPARKEASP